MAFKLTTTTHDSLVCPGVAFRLFRKTYGRRMELDKRLAEYNQQIRALTDQRTMLWEEARTKALISLGAAAPKSENVIQIASVKKEDGTTTQVADAVDPQDSVKFRTEMLKNLDLKQVADIDDQTQAIRLEKLRPIYMNVYLHSVAGLEDEDETPITYKENMSRQDKELFYSLAPADLIDEIFATLDTEIAMNEVERANFELPTTGGGPVAPAKTAPTTPADTTAPSAASESSTATATAASQTS